MSTTDEYLQARSEWNDRYGMFAFAARRWRTVALCSLGLAALSVGGLILISAQPRQIPYIVEVDREYTPVDVFPAAALDQHTPAMVRSILARWVRDLRLVTIDPAVQRDAVQRVYAHLISEHAAHRTISDWYRHESPFERASEYTVAVEVRQLLSLSKNTWRVEWTETHRDRAGAPLPTVPDWVATVTVVQAAATQATILVNPAGLYIVDIDWSAVQ